MKKQKPFEIDANRCWLCGIEFNRVSTGQNDEDKTKHHAIPHQLKPKLNVLIPVCVKCHRKINKEINRVTEIKSKMKSIIKSITELDVMI